MKTLFRDRNYSRLHRTYATSPAVSVVSFGSRGEGVGLLNGAPISIAGTIPGEVVRCTSITRGPRNGNLQANSFELIKKSPHRVEILCPHFATCGACQFLHFSYSEQLLAKKQLVRSYANEEYWNVISDCVPSPGSAPKKNGNATLHYRNKVTLVAIKDGNQPNGTSTKIGYFHKDDSKKFAPIESCIVASQEINVFLKDINELIEDSGIDALIPSVEKERKRRLRKAERGIIRDVTDESQNNDEPFLAGGSLRHIVVRSTSLGKLHITIVTNGEQVEQRDTLVNLIQTRYGQLIESIHHTTNMADSRYYRNVFQKHQNENDNRVMFEKVLGMQFWFSVQSFLQTNLKQSENIYKHVIEAMKGMDCVIDAYCGIGILSCILAEKKSLVIGIDSMEENIDDATFNSQQNNVQSKIQFYLGKSEELLPSAFAECKKLWWSQNPDARRMSGKIGLVANPPRTGLNDFVLQDIAQQSPSTIAYISCNPETLFSDIAFLQQLSRQSYTLEKIIPFDMFPHTNHVETLAILEKRNLE